MNEDDRYCKPKYEQWEEEKSYCHMKKEPKFCGCKPTKKCLKTFDCTFKLYRLSYCRLYKVCQSCGHEYDFHHHVGVCPRCGSQFHHMGKEMDMMDPE